MTETVLADGSTMIEIPREGPYRVLFDRLQRLVRYRSDLLTAVQADGGNVQASSELVRVRHMIKEVHRGVSINLGARQLAQQIDPGESAPTYAY
ncbi:MAG TPA: hypothetical protein VNM48_02760 [Chloroflexota bacterium]|nr:hypothetical protein [Chloroflexota bacterium]